jgi:hypothetical protein
MSYFVHNRHYRSIGGTSALEDRLRELESADDPELRAQLTGRVDVALWTFSEVDGIEPTNNRAERGLRGAVIYRKLSLGSQSEAGERTIERLLSASQTCRLQRRSLFAYSVSGRATLVDEGADEQIDRLAKKYLGKDSLCAPPP